MKAVLALLAALFVADAAAGQETKVVLAIEGWRSEARDRGLNEQNKGRSNIRDVRLVDVRERTVEGVRVMQVGREVDWASGNTTFSIEARLIGPQNSYSLVSDSPGREWTHNNFEGFLPRLL